MTYKVFGILSEFTFKKTERLKSKKAIAGLFSKENNVSFVAYPFKVVWMPAEDVLEYPVQVAISVPKRVFKTAVQRNVLKRRTREAWRLNKMVFYSTLEESNLKIVMMLVYIAKEELSFQEIERGIKKVCYKFEPPKK